MGSKVNFDIVYNRLRAIWIVCYGLITMMVVASMFVNHIWIPYVAFVLMAVVIAFGHHNLEHSSINCSMMTHYTFFTLFVSGLIMLGLNLMKSSIITSKYSQFAGSNSPFHVSLIIYPVATVLLVIANLRRGKPEYCKACKEQSGFSISESLKRNAIHHESKLQLRAALGLSFVTSVIVWVYYFMYYRNASFRGPDKFFLIYVPVFIYFVSVIYFVLRYSNIEFEIKLTGSDPAATRRQLLRFMVVKGDEVLMNETASVEDIGITLWDTPAIISFDLPHEISDERAKHLFENMADVKECRIRRLFMTNIGDCNISHYAVFLDPQATTGLPGQWFNLYAIDSMLKSGMVTRSFAYEIHRIFTITMAWKTYSRDGKRLYPIKNYRPTFRLRDFQTWDVDYNDLAWMSIAENNEDSRFYKLRKFWREHISGVDKRWRRE